MSRPICVHCGKAYGRRVTKSETVEWPAGEEIPPYRGNGIVSRVVFHTHAHGPLTIPDFKGVDVELAARGNVAYREIWDGESWFAGYRPFCTLRCALDYARRAWGASQKAKLKVVK